MPENISSVPTTLLPRIYSLLSDGLRRWEKRLVELERAGGYGRTGGKMRKKRDRNHVVCLEKKKGPRQPTIRQLHNR